MFVKDPKKFEVARKAFERFCLEKLGDTPLKLKDDPSNIEFV